MSHGSASRTAAIISTFSGTKNGREHAHRDQLGVGRHVGADGHRDPVDQAARAGPDRQQDAGHHQTVDAVEQAVAQLDQVGDERLLGAGEFVFLVLVWIQPWGAPWAGVRRNGKEAPRTGA